MEKAKRRGTRSGSVDINIFGYNPQIKTVDKIKAQELVANHFGPNKLAMAREVLEALGILEEYRDK